MANLVVSNQCNLHCTYCFSREHLNDTVAQKSVKFIDELDFEARLDFLERSSIEEARLIGGEPSLHPQFVDLIQQAERRFSKIVVFSNGILTDTILDVLETIPPERLIMIFNMSSSPKDGCLSKQDHALRMRALTRLGERIMLGYTIADVNFDCAHLLHLISDYGCQKSLRIGLAQPVLSGQNAYLHPKQYPAVGNRLAAFAVRAADQGVRLQLDCGFVRCMFTPTELTKLNNLNINTEWRCSPVLDIDLQGEISHCFPLAGRFTATLDPKTRAPEHRQWFTQQAKPYRVAGIYRECSTCKYKLDQECSGGCLATTMLRFRPASFRTGGALWS